MPEIFYGLEDEGEFCEPPNSTWINKDFNFVAILLITSFLLEIEIFYHEKFIF